MIEIVPSIFAKRSQKLGLSVHPIDSPTSMLTGKENIEDNVLDNQNMSEHKLGGNNEKEALPTLGPATPAAATMATTAFILTQDAIVNASQDITQQQKEQTRLVESKKTFLISSIQPSIRARDIFKKVLLKRKEESQEKKVKPKNIINMSLVYVEKFIRLMKQQSSVARFRSCGKNQLSIINDRAADYDYYFIHHFFEKQTPSFLQLLTTKIERIKIISWIKNITIQKLRLDEIDFIFLPTSLTYTIWSLFLLTVLTLNILYVPLSISFYDVELSSFAQACLDTVPNLCFILEILVKFNTAIYKKGLIIKSRKTIVGTYLSKRFWYDLLIVFCFLAGSYSEKAYLQTVLLLRFFDIVRLIADFEERFNLREQLYGAIDLTKLILFILFIAHLCGCVWHYIAYIEIEYGAPQTWLGKSSESPLELPWQDRYVNSLYWSVVTMCTLGYGDIIPVTLKEKAFTIGVTLISCFVFGYSVNQIGDILKEYLRVGEEFKVRMAKLNIYMKQRELSHEVSVKVRKYFEYLHKESNQQNIEGANLIDSLEIDLKSEVLRDVYGKLLRSKKLFHLNFNIDKLALRIKEKTIGLNEYVYKEKDEAEHIYFLLRGSIEVLKTATSTRFQSIEKEMMFGEIEFFTGQLRQFSLRATSVAQLAYLSKKDFIEIARDSPSDYEKFRQLSDSIHIYSDIQGMDHVCGSCGKYTHLTINCPLINVVINKTKTLSSQNLSIKQERKSSHSRDRNRSYGTLARVCLIQQLAKAFYNSDKNQYSVDFDQFNEADDGPVGPISRFEHAGSGGGTIVTINSGKAIFVNLDKQKNYPRSDSNQTKKSRIREKAKTEIDDGALFSLHQNKHQERILKQNMNQNQFTTAAAAVAATAATTTITSQQQHSMNEFNTATKTRRFSRQKYNIKVMKDPSSSTSYSPDINIIDNYNTQQEASHVISINSTTPVSTASALPTTISPAAAVTTGAQIVVVPQDLLEEDPNEEQSSYAQSPKDLMIRDLLSKKRKQQKVMQSFFAEKIRLNQKAQQEKRESIASSNNRNDSIKIKSERGESDNEEESDGDQDQPNKFQDENEVSSESSENSYISAELTPPTQFSAAAMNPSLAQQNRQTIDQFQLVKGIQKDNYQHYDSPNQIAISESISVDLEAQKDHFQNIKGGVIENEETAAVPLPSLQQKLSLQTNVDSLFRQVQGGPNEIRRKVSISMNKIGTRDQRMNVTLSVNEKEQQQLLEVLELEHDMGWGSRLNKTRGNPISTTPIQNNSLAPSPLLRPVQQQFPYRYARTTAAGKSPAEGTSFKGIADKNNANEAANGSSRHSSLGLRRSRNFFKISSLLGLDNTQGQDQFNAGNRSNMIESQMQMQIDESNIHGVPPISSHYGQSLHNIDQLEIRRYQQIQLKNYDEEFIAEFEASKEYKQYFPKNNKTFVLGLVNIRRKLNPFYRELLILKKGRSKARPNQRFNYGNIIKKTQNIRAMFNNKSFANSLLTVSKNASSLLRNTDTLQSNASQVQKISTNQKQF